MALISRVFLPLVAVWVGLVAAGCGSSTPAHAERPLTAAPTASASEFDRLTTPEEKIKYIESSRAPEIEKKRAIEQIQSGKL